MEPDTSFCVKDIKAENGYKRIIVEVNKFPQLPLSDVLGKFNEAKDKRNGTPINKDKPQGLPKPKKTGDSAFLIETKKKIFEGILCPAVLKKEEFDSLRPYNTYALIREFIPTSSFASCIHFCEFMSKEILSNVALFKSELAKSGMAFNIDEEAKKFVQEYLKLINAIHEKAKVASRVELKITFSNTKDGNLETMKKYAKYAAQQLLKNTKADKTDYFMYNGAINFRGFHGKTAWITMYVKDGTNTAEVAAWANKQSIKYVSSILAEPFELGYMNFFIPFTSVNNDINKMLRAVLVGSYDICPEFVSNYESKARNVREFLICCVTRQSKNALLTKAINFFSKAHPFYESVKVDVNSADGDFLAKPYGDGFYFTDISLEKDPAGKDIVSIILPNSSYYEYFVKIVDPRMCNVKYGYNKPLPQVQQQQQQRPQPQQTQFQQPMNPTRQMPQSMPMSMPMNNQQQFGMSQSMSMFQVPQQSMQPQFNQGWQQQQQQQQFCQQQQHQQQFGQQPPWFGIQANQLDSLIKAYYQSIPDSWKQAFLAMPRDQQIYWATKSQSQPQQQQPQQPQPQVQIQIPGTQPH